MNMNNLILDAYRKRDKAAIDGYKTQLTAALDELNLFFDEYLEVFSDRMSSDEDKKDPVWKAYEDKFKEQTQASQNLKLANYYLGML